MKRPRPSHWSGEDLAPIEAAARLHELSALYEVARHLLGARELRDVGARLVLSAMGALGARSGAFLLSRARGRFVAGYAAGAAEGMDTTVELSDRACQWVLEQGVFETAEPEARAALGAAAAGALVRNLDAGVAAALRRGDELEGLLLLGPKLSGGDYVEADLELLAAFAGLAERALAGGEMAMQLGQHTTLEAPTRTSERHAALLRRFPPLRKLVGSSAAMLETCEDLVAVAASDCTVLLLGESGAGKELAARALHEISARAEGPFEVVDCGSIPSELIESELFGHVRGAFTGAARDRRGAFEMAHRGTLFLDEIGEMPMQSQTRLLRVLQEGRFRRVGDERTLDVDVRVVAATNRELQKQVAQGRFREDLFYRLNVFPVRLPPLREHPADIAPLLLHFLDQRATALGRGGFRVQSEVVELLQHCPFPGNVRELANLAAALAVAARHEERITRPMLERVWRRQHDGPPPWEEAPAAPGHDLGAWALDQARRSRFNLVEAERRLRREKTRGGESARVPIAERSALAYYLQGEMLRAFVAHEGDVGAAAAALAGDADLVPRVSARLGKLVDELRAAPRGDGDLQRRFSKLPRIYMQALSEAARLVE